MLRLLNQDYKGGYIKKERSPKGLASLEVAHTSRR